MKVFLNDLIKKTPDNVDAIQSQDKKSKLEEERSFKKFKKEWRKFSLIQLKD